MQLTTSLDREVDGRWIAEIPELNVLVYGATRQDAIHRAESAARELIPDMIAHCQLPPRGHRSGLQRRRMSVWPSAKARRVFAAPIRLGWRHDHTVGSHKILEREGWPNYRFSFHDSDELGPAILARISKKTGLQPKDP